MTRLTPAAYLAHLRTESSRFREVAAAAPPDRTVPACPDWTVDDLVWHLAEVQWFWSRIVAARPAGPPDDEPDRPAGRSEVVAFFDRATTALADALAGADGDEAAWSWAAEQTVGFTFRRQAHEALIHRLDAEQATDEITPLPAELAADGVAELMDVIYGGPPPVWGRFDPSGRHTAIEVTDTGHRVRVATGVLEGTDPDSGRRLDGPHVLRVDDAGPADVTVSGPAAALDAWLWRRAADTDITVEGDEAAYAEWRAAVDQPVD